MVYVFDTSSFIALSKLLSWEEKINSLVKSKKIISVKEAFKEIELYYRNDDLKKWAKKNKDIFEIMSEEESQFLSDLFSKHPEFRYIINSKIWLKPKPCADPFVIAKAGVLKKEKTLLPDAFDVCVVSEEKDKKNAPKIPNICKEYDIPYKSLKEFIESEGLELSQKEQ